MGLRPPKKVKYRDQDESVDNSRTYTRGMRCEGAGTFVPHGRGNTRIELRPRRGRRLWHGRKRTTTREWKYFSC